MKKFEIVNALIAKHGYNRYLEISTPTTGLCFGRVDQSSLHWRHRLVYRCPAGFRDGCEITFRSEDENISHLLNAAMRCDIIFVDSYHTFECSLRDLHYALDRLSPGGAIVVHDCCPKNKSLCGPSFRPGSWFGVTYCAYIEFILSHTDLAYYTVDTDCGCGVIKKLSPDQATVIKKNSGKDCGSNHEITRLWFGERNQHRDMFDFFCQHRRELLKLISVKDFLATENIVLPRFLHWRENLAALLPT